ncbi:MAG: hypothetical protein L6R42_002685, partial [Xanthoria sp. 1 TBL-2021]
VQVASHPLRNSNLDTILKPAWGKTTEIPLTGNDQSFDGRAMKKLSEKDVGGCSGINGLIFENHSTTLAWATHETGWNNTSACRSRNMTRVEEQANQDDKTERRFEYLTESSVAKA